MYIAKSNFYNGLIQTYHDKVAQNISWLYTVFMSKAVQKKQWFENPEFWLNFGPIMFDSQRWAEAPNIARRIVKIADLKEGSSILDAGCGPGRIAVELAVLGPNVTGVDIIQDELDAAAETAEDEGVKLNLIKADLRNFTEDYIKQKKINGGKKFDAACNIYTSFGYCDTIEEDFLILQNIAASLKEGGTFIMECTSRETAIMYFTEGEWFEREGQTVLTEFTVEGAWEGLRSRWILIDNKTGKRFEHEFVQRLYSAADLRQMMIKAGFSSAKVFGNFDLSPYDQNARTMVIVAKK